jgi:broad specificity phosphatase PhoE
MKPKRIILIRHGESEGNLDRNTYALKQDFKLLLTSDGKEQADAAGLQIKQMVGNERVLFYVSPLWRTRNTFEHIARHFAPEKYAWKEDPRLREQEWGHFRDLKANVQIDNERNRFGTFYYRIKDGESCADVYDRVSDFLHSLYRDFEKPYFPENVVIVTHGMTLRLFLMRWFHWTIESFESLRNPRNCEIVVMLRNDTTGKFALTTELRRKNIRDEDKYLWQYVPDPDLPRP